MNKDPSIILRDINLHYPLFDNYHRSLKQVFMSNITGGRIASDIKKNKEVIALKNISLNIVNGERVGIFGHNGSGKTTFLKLLSKIYTPSSGFIEIKGKSGSLLNISSALDPDASGYENIFLRGLIEGLSENQISNKINSIIEFSGLGEFIYHPLRTYSSGMMMRLAFSMSTSVNYPILLMDEWLSVGDNDFTKKAELKLHSLINQSSILVIASHNYELIKKLCTRCLIFSHGEIVKDEKL